MKWINKLPLDDKWITIKYLNNVWLELYCIRLFFLPLHERKKDAEALIKQRQFDELVSSQHSKENKFLTNDVGLNSSNNNNGMNESDYDSEGNNLSAKEKRKRKNASRKRVRKEEDEYETMILKAFENHTQLTKKHLEQITGEPWVCIMCIFLFVCLFLFVQGY